MGHTQGGWEEQEQEQVCHGQHASARMSNTRTDSDVARETGEQKGAARARLHGGHTTDGARLRRWWQKERDNEPGTDPNGPEQEHICCPARHMRITLAVPCVNSCLPIVLSVCATCAGNACNGQGTCPWTSTVAANVTALGTGAAITLAALLPVKILRLFPRPVLESISALSVRTLDVFDPSGKPISEILAAVKHGRFTRECR